MPATATTRSIAPVRQCETATVAGLARSCTPPETAPQMPNITPRPRYEMRSS